MKTTLFLLAALTGLNATAQKIELTEGSEKFSSGSQNAISTTVFANTQDDVQSNWKSLLKDLKNEKVKSEKNEVFGDNVLIKEFGNNPVDIYATFEENKKEMTVKMHVAFDLGGAYLKSSEQKEKFDIAQKMIKDFAIKLSKAPLEQKVKDAEKIQLKLEDSQKDLEKQNKELKSDIDSYNGKIKKAEEDIKKNESDQQAKKAEIEKQKQILIEAKKAVDKVD